MELTTLRAGRGVVSTTEETLEGHGGTAAGDVSSHGRSCSGSPLGAGGINQCSTRRSHDGASGAAQEVLLAA